MFIYRFVATKSKPSGPIELPSGTILRYDRALASDGCLIAFNDSDFDGWGINECFSVDDGQFKAPENGHYLFFFDAPVYYHDAHENEFAQAAIDFIYNSGNLYKNIIVRSFLDSVDSVDFVPISNNLRQTQRSLTGFFTQRMYRGDVMSISNRFEKTISVGPW